MVKKQTSNEHKIQHRANRWQHSYR